MYKYSIIIFIKNLNNLSCLSSYKIIFYQNKKEKFKFSKLANVFPISKRGNKRIQISFKTLEIRNLIFFFFFLWNVLLIQFERITCCIEVDDE